MQLLIAHSGMIVFPRRIRYTVIRNVKTFSFVHVCHVVSIASSILNQPLSQALVQGCLMKHLLGLRQKLGMEQHRPTLLHDLALSMVALVLHEHGTQQAHLNHANICPAVHVEQKLLGTGKAVVHQLEPSAPTLAFFWNGCTSKCRSRVFTGALRTIQDSYQPHIESHLYIYIC